MNMSLDTFQKWNVHEYNIQHIVQRLNKKANMAQYGSSEYQTSLETIGLSVKFKTDCQDGGYGNHLGFLMGRILAIFYL